MNSKIKTTLNFVKMYPKINKREIEIISIISSTEEEATAHVDSIVGSWVTTDRNENNEILYQCYLSDIETTSVYEAVKLEHNDLTPEFIVNFIADKSVKLLPTKFQWEDQTRPATYVTHDIFIDNIPYKGMSIKDAIFTHVNRKESV